MNWNLLLVLLHRQQNCLIFSTQMSEVRLFMPWIVESEKKALPVFENWCCSPSESMNCIFLSLILVFQLCRTRLLGISVKAKLLIKLQRQNKKLDEWMRNMRFITLYFNSNFEKRKVIALSFYLHVVFYIQKMNKKSISSMVSKLSKFSLTLIPICGQLFLIYAHLKFFVGKSG